MAVYGALNNANVDTGVNLNGLAVVGGGGTFPSGGGTVSDINFYAAKISGGGTDFRVALYQGGTSSTDPTGATLAWDSGVLDASAYSTSDAWRTLTGLSIALTGSLRTWMIVKSDIALAMSLALSADCGDLPVSWGYYTGTTSGMNVSTMTDAFPGTVSANVNGGGGSSNLKFYLTYTASGGGFQSAWAHGSNIILGV